MKKSLKNLVLVTLSVVTLGAASLPVTTTFAQDDAESEEVVEEEATEEEAEETEEEATEEEAAEGEEEADDEAEAEDAEAELPVITKAELAAATGQDGNPAYVAVFGLVYDVTDHDAWADAEHYGIAAGADISEALVADSPHDMTIVDGLEPVGSYTDWEVTTDLLANFGPDNEATPNLIAVNGLVYDVTDVEAWAGGEHNGVSAGTDGTEAIAEAPHGESTLEGLTVVGHHVDYVFDAETLAEFNGQDDAPAYVAVDGVVYNVTGYEEAWVDGEHNGVTAGTDASEAIGDSPHDAEFLENLPVVGQFE